MVERLTDRPQWQQLPGADWPWLQARRLEALRELEAEGLPGPGVEDWKYTRLGDLPERRFLIAGECSDDRNPRTESPLPGHFLLFRNGRYCAQGSRLLQLPAGARVIPLCEAMTQERVMLENHLGRIAQLRGQPFAALNTSRFGDGLLLWLAAGVRLEAPIHCRFEGPASETPEACFPRLLVLLEARSEAQLIEESAGRSATGAHLSDLLCEISLGEGARLFHGRQIADSDAATQIAGIHVEQAPGSRYQAFTLNLSGGLCRNDLRVHLRGDGAEALLDGLYLLDGHRHLDNHLRVDHLAPGGRSDQFYKGILDGHARGVFNGLAVVHPDAQRSDARQINKNLLLSPGAEIDTKPELQIEADDVKCSHGATVGCLDEEALYYLRSRGLSLTRARALLTLAFARETLHRLPSGAVRDWFEAAVERRLQASTAENGDEPVSV